MEKKMKNSGIEWVGEIPDNWKIERMKSCIALREGGAWGEEETGDSDTVCLRVADFDYDRFVFKNTSISALTKRHYSKSTVAKLKLLKGDIVIEKSGGGDKTPVGRTVIFDKDYVALFANFMDRLRCCAFVYPKFMQYIFVTFYKNQYTRNYIKQTTGIQNLDLSLMLNREHVPMPPIEEQKAIAGFLDKKCGEVDALIADIQQEIETLEQYKRSVITEAVTKGLDPSVPMKDSGIDWVGNMPKHWKKMPNKYLMYKEKTICPLYNGESILSLTMKGVVVRDLDAGGKMPTSFDGYQQIEAGNLLMCLFDIDVTPRCIGLICNNGVTSPAYSQFIMKEDAYAPFYSYYYLMVDFTKELLHMAKNLRHSLNEEQFGAILAPVPPIEEQRQIADYLDKKCKEIEEIIADKQSQIETLESYKKSLIYEYVTGKKEIIA